MHQTEGRNSFKHCRCEFISAPRGLNVFLACCIQTFVHVSVVLPSSVFSPCSQQLDWLASTRNSACYLTCVCTQTYVLRQARKTCFLVPVMSSLALHSPVTSFLCSLLPLCSCTPSLRCSPSYLLYIYCLCYHRCTDLVCCSWCQLHPKRNRVSVDANQIHVVIFLELVVLCAFCNVTQGCTNHFLENVQYELATIL